MIRIVYVFHRLPYLSRKRCQQHWLEVHGPLVKKHAELLGIQGYAQLHTVGSRAGTRIMRLLRGTMAPYDGTAELWVDREKMTAAMKTEAGKEAAKELIRDEQRFIDFNRSALWTAKEHLILKRSGPPARNGPVRKFTWVGRRLPHLSQEEFQSHYLNNHAPLVKENAEALGVYEYTQIHLTEDPLNEILRGSRGTAAPFYVHAQFVWDFGHMLSPSRLMTTRQIMGEIAEDEKLFIDFSRSAIWTAEEHVIIPPPG